MSAGSTVTSISGLALSKLAQVAGKRLLGNNGIGAGNVAELDATTAKSLLAIIEFLLLLGRVLHKISHYLNLLADRFQRLL